MKAERLATALSVAVLLALAGWLAGKAMPRAAPHLAAPGQIIPDQPTPRAPIRVVREAAAVALPPPPPRSPPADVTAMSTAKPPPVIAALAAPVKPLRPSRPKVAATPSVTPLTPTDPPAAEPAIEKTAVLKAAAPAPKAPTPKMLKPQAPTPKAPEPVTLKSKVPAPKAPEPKVPEPKAPEAIAADRQPETRKRARAAPDPAAMREGRVLLRVLEHGAGPSIEIAWPEAAATRTRLFRRFTQCFGMRVALMRGGKLFTEAGPPGAPWAINLDRFSGFVRQPAGRLMAGEHRLSRRIRARHPGLSGAVLVRIFPRRVDALLLAGLKRIAGAAYKKDGVIRARYRLTGGHVMVTDVRVDGRAAPGRIDLPPSGRGCRGGV